jgi:hypothetical protein
MSLRADRSLSPQAFKAHPTADQVAPYFPLATAEERQRAARWSVDANTAALLKLANEGRVRCVAWGAEIRFRGQEVVEDLKSMGIEPLGPLPVAVLHPIGAPTSSFAAQLNATRQPPDPTAPPKGSYREQTSAMRKLERFQPGPGVSGADLPVGEYSREAEGGIGFDGGFRPAGEGSSE